MEGGQPLPLYRADLLQTAAAAPDALAVKICAAAAAAATALRGKDNRNLKSRWRSRHITKYPSVHNQKVLPPGEKRTQKIAVGDADGVLTVFSVKRGAVALAHKGLRGPAPVAAVTMGRGSKQRDQVFSAAGNTVRGEFF
jgi:hypothetical protein